MHSEIHVIDSHTEGEPTRVVTQGGPPLADGPLEQRLQQFRDAHDAYRTAIITEPRGWDVLVGALLCEPDDPSCDAGVIFFNNVGYLGMCGHGMIGVIETLKHLGRIGGSHCQVETPVGIVSATLNSDESVSIQNVESFRKASDVKIDVDEIGTVVGDVAWGGNWFFLVQEPQQFLEIQDSRRLMRVAAQIRTAVHEAGYPEVDHVELFGPPHSEEADARNFVLCPGLEYDRSPCGTGTSAKLACLAADGKLKPGQEWVQEGILGTSFIGRFQWANKSKKTILPTIRGRAYVTAQSRLYLDPDDPFCWGIRGGVDVAAPGAK